MREVGKGGQAMLLVCSSLTVMAGATISPSLPAIGAHYGDAPYAQTLVPLIITVPALIIALTAAPAGWVTDRWGRLPVLAIGLVVYALGGASGLWVHSLYTMLAGRAVLGLGVGMTMTATTTLISDYYDGPARERFTGYQAAFMGFGGVFFIMGGGLLADLHWRGPFAVYLLALPLLIGVKTALYEPDPAERDSAPAQEGGRGPNEEPWKARALMIFLIGFVGMVLFFTIPVHLPFYLQEIGETSATRIGFALACSTLFGAMTSLNYRRVRRRFSYRAIYIIQFVLMGGGMLLVAHSTSYLEVLPAMFVFGTGLGLLMPNSVVWLAMIAPARMRGRAIGGLTTAIFLGQFVSPLTAQPIIAANGYNGLLGLYALGGFIGLAIAAGFTVWVVLNPVPQAPPPGAPS